MKLLAAIGLLFIGWLLGVISLFQLTSWAGSRIVYWEYFLSLCGDKCKMAMAIALDNHLLKLEKGN